MKIDYLKINGFGKLIDKEINFKNGINIVFGQNESGKSTILKFISSMFYGASRNKNGKEISDFERFKPWKTEDYSGKLRYTLDNKQTYEIFREFKKKNPIIYNEKMEDISKQFSIEKNKGIDFFVEQTKIDEETFYSTAITEQEGIRLSKSSQNSIVQKISNLVSSGDDNISFNKSIEKINKMQNEQVGTNKTLQRPINLIENKIRGLINEKKSLEIYKEDMYDSSIEREQLYLEEKSEEIKKEFLKEIKNKLDNNRIKNAEINFNKNLENDYDKKIKELNKKIDEERNDSKENIKVNFKSYYIILLIFIIVTLFIFFAFPNNKIKFVSIIPIFIIVSLIVFKKIKYSNDLQKNKNESEQIKFKIVNEIELLKKNRENQKLEAEEKLNKLKYDREKEKKSITEKYIKLLDLGYIEENLEKNYDEILREIEVKENRLNTIKFRIHTMEKDAEAINNKLDDLAKVEEELHDAETERDELISLNNSFNLAKECMEIAYDKVKANISPRFTQNLCDIISKISNDKYKKIAFNDIDGLNVEIDNGQYIPVSRLSVGTIDQMYFALRMSSLNEIIEETMPIILDEAFAYFDNERLRNILKYINLNYSNDQVIIFTCSNRERQILDELKINYNEIMI